MGAVCKWMTSSKITHSS
uniref:Uncharacterized protein n=1 Tax=Anguilla anguilla TaxID=7936 RepID=A0A0E9TDL1_ANGAN